MDARQMSSIHLFFRIFADRKLVQMRIYQILILLSTLLFMGCNGNNRKTDSAEIVVSIEPIKYIVEQIVGDQLKIKVLTPAGSSPETYEPTPHDMIAIDKAKMIFSTGLIEFETNLLSRIGYKDKTTVLSQGIELIEGDCSHAHSHNHAHHSHGVDPHIWTSPQELRTMAHNAHEAIMRLYPNSIHYTTAYTALDSKLAALDEECRATCKASSAKAFVIYHPALTYYARAYNLEQIAIENDGKEPSVKHIAHIITRAKEQGATTLLYQREFPRSVVEVIAEDMELEAREINPLADDPIAFIKEITQYITSK